jgi:type I restriction enzyme S subunit
MSGALPYLEIGNIDINEKGYSFSDKRSVKGCKNASCNDVLISRVRPDRGAIVYVREPELQVSSAFSILRNKGVLADKYLWYYLAWNKDYLNYLGKNCTGTMYPTTSDDIIVDYEVPVAPLAEQQRIVNKLEKIFDKISSSRKRLARIPYIFKRYHQSILYAAISGQLTADWRKMHDNAAPASCLIKGTKYKIIEPETGLPVLPEKWEWVALGNYANCARGRFSVRPRNDPRYFNGKHPFIQIGDLPSEGGWIEAHTQTLNDKGLSVSKKFSRGTAVIAIVGATIGNTGILAYDMCFTDSMVGIDTGTEFGNRYVELFLQCKKYEIRNASYSSGGQPNIKLETLNPYPVALPPLEEQKEIVLRVESLLNYAARLEKRYFRAREHLDRLSQSILAKAFHGALVPQDPNEEPANILLERIRLQKND